MTEKPSFDPFEAWRDFVTKFENEANSFANNNMKSEQFGQFFGLFSQLSAQMRQLQEKALDEHFKTLQLPRRNDIAALEERLQRLEDKIDLLLPMELREPPEVKPRRTRKPLAEGAGRTREGGV